MRRDPYLMAALASAALPGAEPTRVQLLDGDGADLDIALVEDDGGTRHVISVPRSPAAGADLEREAAALGLLARLAGNPAVGVQLPFVVPAVAGSTPLPEGGRAVVTTWVPGEEVDVTALGPGPLTASLAQALAVVHGLPGALVDDAGLPVWSASEVRGRRLSELDRAASTGRVPPRLLSRWELALEEVRWWRFSPVVVHGDLDGTRVLTDGRTVTGITGWGSLSVGDPADDLGWLAAAAPTEALEAVLTAHAQARHEPLDPALGARARLAGEMALARYLLHGVALDDDDVLDDATVMLEDLDASLDDGDQLSDELG
ncbi:Predicted kinase, aminoglycoside phosphotransferase (APT) family [Quadrisphaera granulorum]|uniref:Aminoglycoside phosphotransferase (APT) family kinase protein n=1 Tax=Quadrisphaera granulorum TaxID=317664 RepID=A0A316AF57_9ACTN|nr:phosphotransferase [Quadrisphaera granulorum]PWJ56231.1 aminoglycoside phosphotransferase (APT) family kinase protein [Quadrisphaera granulorum]SZE94865.1 Predicted kinase, aminoglycoside phosphotransferase (APT) family [Quadrisphaera granulorum]